MKLKLSESQKLWNKKLEEQYKKDKMTKKIKIKETADNYTELKKQFFKSYLSDNKYG